MDIAYTILATATGGYIACATVDGRPALYTPSALRSEALAHEDGRGMVRRLEIEYGVVVAAPSAEQTYLGRGSQS